MKYYNWQAQHKSALSSKTQDNKINSPRSEVPASNSIEIIHLRAWVQLKAHCTWEELEKLKGLAEQYDRG